MEGDQAIPQGASWDLEIKYKENDVIVDFSTGYTARMQVRTDYDGQIILDLYSTSGNIQLTSGAGDTPNVVIKFTPALTTPINIYTGMIYDLEITNSSTGAVTKFLKGRFALDREVTK